jgi:hypothetical protein
MLRLTRKRMKTNTNELAQHIGSPRSNSNFEFLKNFQVAKACTFYEKNHPIFLKCE